MSTSPGSRPAFLWAPTTCQFAPGATLGNRANKSGTESTGAVFFWALDSSRPPGDAVFWRPVGQDPWSASVHCQLGPGEVQMRARTETIELGERVARALTMENSGPARRRIWWIVSSAVLAPLSRPQAA
jgi:hypothetical protein